MAPILLVVGILACCALIWAYIESRRPRTTISAGMPEPTTLEHASPEEAMQAAVLASGRFKPKEWEVKRRALIFIHEGSHDAELNELAREITGNPLPEAPPTDFAETEEEPAPSLARERFRSATEGSGRVEFLGTFYAPGPFDAYLRR